MTKWRLQTRGTLAFNGDDAIMTILDKGGQFSSVAQIQCKFYVAFTCTDMRAELITADVTSTLTLKDDDVNTTVAISLSATTGWYEDVTDSATPAADSLMHVQLINSGTMHGDDVAVESLMLTIEHASVDAPMFAGGDLGTLSVTTYSPLGTRMQEFTTEADVAHTIQRATVMANLRHTCRSATSADIDFSPFKNGTASTEVTVNILGTGTLEDLTGSESYASGDTASWGFVLTAGDFSSSSAQLDADTPEKWMNTVQILRVTSTQYYAFNGDDGSSTAEDLYFQRIGSVSAGHLQCFVSEIGTAPMTTQLRVGSTDSSNLIINITATGHANDLTGSESVADGDSVVTKTFTTGGQLTIDWVAVECPWSDPTAGGSLPPASPISPQLRHLINR